MDLSVCLGPCGISRKIRTGIRGVLETLWFVIELYGDITILFLTLVRENTVVKITHD
jgi:hypothetical protein